MDWSNCTQPYKLDDQAFKVYGKGNKKGQMRANAGEEDTPTAITNELWSKDHYKRRVINQINTAGSFEQQRLVLNAALTDLLVVNVASSIGVNLEEAAVHRDILINMRNYLQRARTTTNKNNKIGNNRRMLVNAICTAAIKTPPKNIDNLYSTKGHGGHCYP